MPDVPSGGIGDRQFDLESLLLVGDRATLVDPQVDRVADAGEMFLEPQPGLMSVCRRETGPAPLVAGL